MYLEINTARKVEGPRRFRPAHRDESDSWAIYIASEDRHEDIVLGACSIDMDPTELLREVRKNFPSLPLHKEAADLAGIDLRDDAHSEVVRKLFDVSMPDGQEDSTYIVCAATPIEALNVYAYNVIQGQISTYFDNGEDTRMLVCDITQPVDETRVVKWEGIEQIAMYAADVPLVKAAVKMNFDFELGTFDDEEVADDGPSF
jgi:hypothetical protein